MVAMVCLHKQIQCFFSYPAIKLANSGHEFPWTITTSDDGNDSIVLGFNPFNGRKLPKL